MTPFQIVYGRIPPTLIYFTGKPTVPDGLEQQLQEWEEVLTQLRENLECTQARMKQFANCKQRKLEFQVGEWVYLHLQPCH
ncbi:unnamed protein product [Spirodela intermedia]|uniref:Uncharacterized protein n=2 Tax=Spirodela intermedia TaxID=51605 RepID=A0A7I8KSA3_SPIIN|nr:unnamed protein product [Spirodela intermedia]CAA7400521.1 unnamed protein product [Spirodela intermedia]